MKATGEVMAIGRTFEEALMKAVRGAEIGVTSLNLPVFEEESDEKEVVTDKSQNDLDDFDINLDI